MGSDKIGSHVRTIHTSTACTPVQACQLLSMQVTEFDTLKVETAKDIENMLKRYKQVDATLFGAQSRAAVEALQRAANAAHKELKARIEGVCASLIESCQLQLKEIVDASEKFVPLLIQNIVHQSRQGHLSVYSFLAGSDKNKWY